MLLVRRILNYFRNPVSMYYWIAEMSDYPGKTRYVGQDLEGKLCQFSEVRNGPNSAYL